MNLKDNEPIADGHRFLLRKEQEFGRQLLFAQDVDSLEDVGFVTGELTDREIRRRDRLQAERPEDLIPSDYYLSDSGDETLENWIHDSSSADEDESDEENVAEDLGSNENTEEGLPVW